MTSEPKATTLRDLISRLLTRNVYCFITFGIWVRFPVVDIYASIEYFDDKLAQWSNCYTN